MNQRNKLIFERLVEMHPDAQCELTHHSTFELLVSVILSARCTDKRVNIITKDLFKVANTPEQMANMPIEELERYIYSCGFYKAKARNIHNMSAKIVQLGYVPDKVNELVSLPGVGIKTASVMQSVAYNRPAIAVDTHVHRVSNRLGIVHTKRPEDTQKQLEQQFDESLWSQLHHLLIFHGRYICKSQNPDCNGCTLNEICEWYKQNNESK